MAEEQNPENGAGKRSSSLIKNLVLFGSAILVPAIVGLLIFNFLLAPKISDDETVSKPPDVTDPFPMTMVEVTFDEQQISVQTEDPEMVAPLLIAQVLLLCRDQATADVVTARKSIFAAMILRYHRGRTRSELNDSLVESSILEQIKQQSNILLRRLNPELDLQVLDAQHLKYTMVDL